MVEEGLSESDLLRITTLRDPTKLMKSELKLDLHPTSVSSILVDILPLSYSSPSYLRTAISNYGVSLGIGNVAGARETVGLTVVQKSRIQCYNCKEFGHVARECQKPKRAKDAAYHKEKMLLCKQEEAGIQLNAKQADWRDDTNDDELEDHEREVHYMYMAQLQEVSSDDADSGPIFDDEPLQKVSNDDHYNVFAMESAHPEQSESVHNIYPIEQDAQNVIIDSLDMSYDREEIDENDDNNDLAKEHELLASLIEKLKCEIDESKNRNKFLETSNKALIEKLKGEIEDFKKKQKFRIIKQLFKRSKQQTEYRHVARECQKLKRAKDAAYHREKMLLCKPEEARIQLNAEQADWKDDTDDESDDQELEAHYMYMAKLQQVSPELKVQNDDHYDVFAIDCQHSE
nr:hypothetical protein [Tanacetum cinerariifolium]